MGLDKWIKSDKDEKKENKQSDVVSLDRKEPKLKKKEKANSQVGMTKFILICTNSKCKYQKVLMKRKLVNRDKICPKCKSEMKVKG